MLKIDFKTLENINETILRNVDKKMEKIDASLASCKESLSQLIEFDNGQSLDLYELAWQEEVKKASIEREADILFMRDLKAYGVI